MSAKPVILLASHEHHDVVRDEFTTRYGRDYDVRVALTLAEGGHLAKSLVAEGRRIDLCAPPGTSGRGR